MKVHTNNPNNFGSIRIKINLLWRVLHSSMLIMLLSC